VEPDTIPPLTIVLISGLLERARKVWSRSPSHNFHQMRLLHKITLQFEEFIGDDSPPYGILSHTWGKDEITFVDMVRYNEGDPEIQSKIKKKRGWGKIEFMQNVTRDVVNINHFWVDTCNIDKSSSAELSEAINSMYRWYSNAFACYAYLSDLLVTSMDVKDAADQLKRAKWFTRGWTLQELLAPKKVVFFNGYGKELGTKETLCTILSETTGIDEDMLMGITHLWDVSIARRMSWASDRETTRTEDKAYSLLGIFGVNLALIYGEGEKAFYRLQEEIMKETYDQSIFAWSLAQPRIPDKYYNRADSVLARNPSYFRQSRNVVRRPGELDAHAMTNKGVKIQLPVIWMPDGSLAAILCCMYVDHPESESVEPYSLAIVLKSTAKGDGSFGRSDNHVDKLILIPDVLRAHAEHHHIYLSRFDDPIWNADIDGIFRYPSRSRKLAYNHFQVKYVAPKHCDWTLYRYISAPKPLDPLTAFEIISDPEQLKFQLFENGVFFLDDGPDRIVAIQCTHIARHMPGFVIILESKNQLASWDIDVYNCAKDIDLEYLVVTNTGGRSKGNTYSYWVGGTLPDFFIHRKRLDDDFWVDVQFNLNSDRSILWIRLTDTKRDRNIENVFELAV
jgi:hypothetical protein